MAIIVRTSELLGGPHGYLEESARRGGLARRLSAGIRSLKERASGNVEFPLWKEGGWVSGDHDIHNIRQKSVEVISTSTGAWSARRLHAVGTLDVRQDVCGGIEVYFFGTFTVTSREKGGGETTFLTSCEEGNFRVSREIGKILLQRKLEKDWLAD